MICIVVNFLCSKQYVSYLCQKQLKYLVIMAIKYSALPIKFTPTLTGEVARRFVEEAEKVEKGPKIDFSEQVKIARAILEKARMRNTI